MSKNIRKLIVATLVIFNVAAIMPEEYSTMLIGLSSAEAATYDEAARGELSRLEVLRSTGSELELRKSYQGDKINLSSRKDYYVELDGSEGIYMNAEVEGSGYVVKAFTSAEKDAEGHNVDDFIEIDSTSTNIYLRTYRSEDDYEEAYNDGNVTNCVKTYVIHIKKKYVEDTEKEQDKEHAYLKSIYISDGEIDFSSDKMDYDVYVDESIEDIIVRAKPIDDDYLVEVNGNSVAEKENYESHIKLDSESNKITIRVESNDDHENYTINIIKVKEKSDVNKVVNGNSYKDSIQYSSGTRNSWVKKNDKFQYIDGTGCPLKDKWWFDVKTGHSYYLDAEGYMKTGWIKYNNKWYYTNQSGEMQTGWVHDGGKWYYLNKGGVMITGWAQDTDGKWYYFAEDGAMVSNTVVGGYTLGADGVLII